MVVKTPKQHRVNYFMLRTAFTPANKGEHTQAHPRPIRLPEAIMTLMQGILRDTLRLATSGRDSSCPRSFHAQSAPIIRFTDAEVEAIAQTAEPSQLIDFYESSYTNAHIEQQHAHAMKETAKHEDCWYVISASSPEGVPLITNFVTSALDLAALVHTILHIKPIVVQEILAFRTPDLHSSLILASSKPF